MQKVLFNSKGGFYRVGPIKLFHWFLVCFVKTVNLSEIYFFLEVAPSFSDISAKSSGPRPGFDPYLPNLYIHRYLNFIENTYPTSSQMMMLFKSFRLKQCPKSRNRPNFGSPNYSWHNNLFKYMLLSFLHQEIWVFERCRLSPLVG